QILGSPDGELCFETSDGRPIVPPPPRIDPGQGGGTAHLRRLAQERGHQIGDGTPWALYGGQPPDYGLAIEGADPQQPPAPAQGRPVPTLETAISIFEERCLTTTCPSSAPGPVATWPPFTPPASVRAWPSSSRRRPSGAAPVSTGAAFRQRR